MAKNGRRPSSRGIVPNNKKLDRKVRSAFDVKINVPEGQEAAFNVQDNTAYLKQREKRASEIMAETGASYEEAIKRYTAERNAAEAGTPMAIAERAQAVEEAKQTLQAQSLREQPQFATNQNIAGAISSEARQLTQEQQAEIDKRSTLLGTGVSALQTAIPVAGATAVGALAGGVGGLVTGSGALGVVTWNQHSKAQDAAERFAGVKFNMNKIIKDLNAGVIDPYDAYQRWNDELEQLAMSEYELKALSANKVEDYLSGAGDDLIELERWKTNLPGIAERVRRGIIEPDPRLATEFPQQNG